MSIELLAKVDATGGVAFLRDALKQVRFAELKAVNQTALDVQQFTVGRLLPSKFTLRAKGSPWYRPGTRMGFNVKFGNKENLESRIGSQADWLNLQEHGGIKAAAGHRVAIPTKFWKAREEIMKREKKPGAILRLYSRYQGRIQKLTEKIDEGGQRGLGHKKLRELVATRMRLKAKRAAIGGLQNLPFISKMPSGHEGIFVRTGKERLPIKMIFDFEDKVTIKPLLEFEKTGKAIAEKNYEVNFANAFTKALLTAK